MKSLAPALAQADRDGARSPTLRLGAITDTGTATTVLFGMVFMGAKLPDPRRARQGRE